MFLEIQQSTDEEERCMEVSFSKLKWENKKNNYLVITRAIPRFYKFKRSDSILDIKKKLFESMRHAWKDNDDEINDKWINDMIFINLRNNSPIKPSTNKYSSITREKCEFCGDAHSKNKELCEI